MRRLENNRLDRIIGKKYNSVYSDHHYNRCTIILSSNLRMYIERSLAAIIDEGYHDRCQIVKSK